MYQGIPEWKKPGFETEVKALEQAFCEALDFDYDENLTWVRDYIYENLFAPITWADFEWDSCSIQVWLEDLRDVSYSAEDAGWDVDGVMEFESRVEMLAEKALEESKIYRIEWED